MGESSLILADRLRAAPDDSRAKAERGECGAEGDRTLDLRIANATLSQLSYRPIETTAGTPTAARDFSIAIPPLQSGF
jgi:hypothetical protein